MADFRKGDRVVVTSGPHAGRIGILRDRGDAFHSYYLIAFTDGDDEERVSKSRLRRVV